MTNSLLPWSPLCRTGAGNVRLFNRARAGGGQRRPWTLCVNVLCLHIRMGRAHCKDWLLPKTAPAAAAAATFFSFLAVTRWSLDRTGSVYSNLQQKLDYYRLHTLSCVCCVRVRLNSGLAYVSQVFLPPSYTSPIISWQNPFVSHIWLRISSSSNQGFGKISALVEISGGEVCLLNSFPALVPWTLTRRHQAQKDHCYSEGMAMLLLRFPLKQLHPSQQRKPKNEPTWNS